MTPKEKAEQLFQLYLPYVQSSNYIEEIKDKCKQCALIAVDEIIEATSIKYEYRDAQIFYAGKKPMQYWLDVKNEIEYI